MNKECCFITYLDVLDKVKEEAMDNYFIVCDVKPLSESGKACQVWVVDEGSPYTALTRAVYLGMRIRNLEYCRS